jgi:hypothetical protein
MPELVIYLSYNSTKNLAVSISKFLISLYLLRMTLIRSLDLLAMLRSLSVSISCLKRRIFSSARSLVVFFRLKLFNLASSSWNFSIYAWLITPFCVSCLILSMSRALDDCIYLTSSGDNSTISLPTKCTSAPQAISEKTLSLGLYPLGLSSSGVSNLPALYLLNYKSSFCRYFSALISAHLSSEKSCEEKPLMAGFGGGWACSWDSEWSSAASKWRGVI